MIYFVLIRHGETSWTKERRYQGSSDTRLNACGKKQIEVFTREVKQYKPDIVFCSALKRAVQSAEILCKPLKITPTQDARLNELNFGEWEGKTADELIAEKNESYGRWIKGAAVTPPGGETVLLLRKRVRAFIKDCVRRHDNQKIIIVTHGGVIRMFLLEFLKLSLKNCFKFRIDPGSMTVIARYDYSNQLVLLNSTTPKKGLVPSGCA